MFFRNSGILGINARNLLYIRPYNKKKAIRLADNKLQTKHFLAARGIPVPKLYFTIRNRRELERFDFNVIPESFVLKPNFGYGGEGIIPIVSREGDTFIKSDGGRIDKDELYDHINDILDGRFSITDESDIAFFEQRIICDERIQKFAYCGLPDIRVVVHNLIPVMAMLRLSTRESGGVANLHQGAIGVGIDIARGEATYIVQGTKIILHVPGVEEDIRKLKIPHWDEILLIASKVQLITNLGYMAVDIALDKNGPVLLEINARAGLAVQIANLAPLRRRLERIQGIKVTTPEKGVRIAQDIFGNKLEKEIQQATGKKIIGIEEEVEIILQGATRRIKAHINNEEPASLLDRDIATACGLFKGQNTVKLKFMLGGHRLQTVVHLENFSSQDHKMIVGRRDLSDFLIDPSVLQKKERSLPKTQGVTLVHSQKKPNFYDIDRRIVDLDKQVKLLHYLSPLNLAEEKARFLNDRSYNPQFFYPELQFDPYKIREDLEDIVVDDSPLGQIFQHKKQEILLKITLLEYIGVAEGFSYESGKLFGYPDDTLLSGAQDMLNRYPMAVDEDDADILDEYTIKRELLQFFQQSGLHGWKIKDKEAMVANLTSGKYNALFLQKGLRMSKTRLQSIIAHEIETHVFTAQNGKQQPYQIFNRGFAFYLKTQEGLAIYNQSRIIGKESRIASLVLAIHRGMKGSFVDVFEFLRSFDIDDDRAFQVAVKVKRGLEDTSQAGGFTKDLVYFQGLHEIEEYERSGRDMKRLFIGKISLEDMGLIDQIPYLKPPKYLPRWLKESA